MSKATVHLRARRQITLPAEIVATAGLTMHDRLEVSLVNGNILLTPTRPARDPSKSMARFLGAFRGVCGASAEAVNACVRELRDEW